MSWLSSRTLVPKRDLTCQLWGWDTEPGPRASEAPERTLAACLGSALMPRGAGPSSAAHATGLPGDAPGRSTAAPTPAEPWGPLPRGRGASPGPCSLCLICSQRSLWGVFSQTPTAYERLPSSVTPHPESEHPAARAPPQQGHHYTADTFQVLGIIFILKQRRTARRVQTLPPEPLDGGLQHQRPSPQAA